MIHLYLRLTQKFVGGALSSLAGMQSFYTAATKAAKATDATTFAKKMYNFKKKANYLFGKNASLLNKSLTYGVQNVLTNFAYSDWDTFSKNNFVNQFFNVGIGMAHGVGQYSLFESKDLAYRLTGSFLFYGSHYMIDTRLNQGYMGHEYYDWKKKTGIFSLKAFVFTY